MSKITKSIYVKVPKGYKYLGTWNGEKGTIEVRFCIPIGNKIKK